MLHETSWKPSEPVAHAPEQLQEAIRAEAAYLLQELQERYLRVILAPAPEPQHCGHKIRSVEQRNPQWYRNLWHAHAYRRRGRKWRAKIDSVIKRTRVQRALGHIIEGTDHPFQERSKGSAMPWIFSYQFLLRSLILQRLQEGHESEEYGKIPPCLS